MRLSSFTLIVSFVCLALVGLAVVPLLPVKLSPSRTLPHLTVSYTLPGYSSRAIEKEVTSRLEAMLSRIEGVHKISSVSGNGEGHISLELDKHTSVEMARFEASTIIRQTWSDLPEGLSYPEITASTPDDKAQRPFMSYTLNAPASPAFVQRYAEDRMKPRLARIDGISRIEVSGATPMEWQLRYDSRRLEQLGITVSDLQEAISGYYAREFLGTVDSESGEWIRLALQPTMDDGFDADKIYVKNREGKLIRLGQLVTVIRQEEAPQSYYRINGLNSVYLSIRAEDDANQLSVAKEVRAEMERIEALLPAGYEIHTSYDATEYIQEELDKIYVLTALTVVILLAFVLLVTWNARYMLLIVISLAVNLCVAFIFYFLLGLEIQLYSLAGITISLSLVIDNTIVMTDHIRRNGDRKAFLPILAATLTTIGALVIVFFLDEEIRLNLQDFAAVVMVNLAVSLLVALFLVPALIEKLGLERKVQSKSVPFVGKLRRAQVYFSRFYMHQIVFLGKHKAWVYVALILAFGLPVFQLPDKIELDAKKEYTASDSLWVERYNKFAEIPLWKETIRPVVEKALGGTLRLFVEGVYEGSYFTRNEETILYVNASLPNGSTLEQMNHLITRMESYLSTFPQIRQFQTSIYNARQAALLIYFTREAERSGFPYVLKSRIVSRALELGGGSWSVYGLMDQGFSNDVRETAGTYGIELLGYNYDELYTRAEQLRDTLMTYRRIKEVLINSEFSFWKDDYQEYYFDLDKRQMAREGITPSELFSSLSPVMGRDIYAGSVLTDGELERVKLSSLQSSEYDIWNLQNVPHGTGQHKLFKLSSLSDIEKGQMPQQINKRDQQYLLCLQYSYIGSSRQGDRVQKDVLKDFNRILPMGYTAERGNTFGYWQEHDSSQYWLLLLIIVIIFFTTSILFNSLRQPLAVIFVIPVSYIGVFLTFYGFGLNFDQGGFASFVLLCGITVNASIYVLNEYNRIREHRPKLLPLQAFVKAWNVKVIPIFLTVLSTVLGFIPFLLTEGKEAFWFPLAAGTIGGLLMSVLAIYLFLPLFQIRFFVLPLPSQKRKKDGR